MSKLVIVESPAKAKTIKQFLGKNYNVQASYGHIRDLPNGADQIPEKYKPYKWATLGVNVEHEFEPIYVIPDEKKRYVKNLQESLKDADEILLATDEDREGESISWHVLQVLHPAKHIKISRIVFHEITPEAIEQALKYPRGIDDHLVRAQEARRVLDRLYGFTLSPVLWRKVAPRLSAGRVQSVAVRILVERERQRKAFKSAGYWDLKAELGTQMGSFEAKLIQVNQQKLASGQHFDPETGQLKDKKVLLLDEQAAKSLAEAASLAEPWRVSTIETKPGQQSSPPPFMTSTLQQEASRKLRFTAKRTMQVAQTLYEGIDLGGERTGLITYMRTDSLTLSERALQQAREVIQNLYGEEYLPDKPVQYRTKAKNAQEAHEAIRPTDLSRRPQEIKSYLNADQYALYELIWKRTIACQMKPARILRTNVLVEVTVQNQKLIFSATGKQIVFPGFLRAYVEGTDQPEAEIEDKEALLPPLEKDQILKLILIDALSHQTKPPARYTEASLIKALEEGGVGRPSTYAAILSTIQDRGYVFKRGNELIPTFVAFAVVQVLEGYFNELVDMSFTAKMEDELDEIALGKSNFVEYLSAFYKGKDSHLGLQNQVETQMPLIPLPGISIGIDPETNLPIEVRVGRNGAFLKRGEGGKENTAGVPEDLPPADLTIEKAVELLHPSRSMGEMVAEDPKSGQPVYYKMGPYGGYLEVALTDEQKEEGKKPHRVSLPPGSHITELNEDDLHLLLSFPRRLGIHPETGEEIQAFIGAYGPYLQYGLIRKKIESWNDALHMDLDQALILLSEPAKEKKQGRFEKAAPKVIKDFDSKEIRILEGRYGPYVTDGKINASLPKGQNPDNFTLEQAKELLESKSSQPKRVAVTKKKRVSSPKKATKKS